MPDKLTLGPRLKLPVDVVTRTAVVVGQKGTGKTSTAVVMIEEATAAGARFAVIDPTGAWYGLRSSADGEGPGLDCVVMGGFNGDVPLSADAGAVVARLVVVEGYNIVCDLERMPRGDQVRFVADFATVAYQQCRSAVTVVVDEARRFVPQSGAKLEEEGQRCRLALIDVVQLGRRKGLGSILIGQRLTNIAADAREQADLLVIHRLLGVNDRKMIAGWLDDAGADAPSLLEEIPKLKQAHAAVLAPEQNVLGIYRIRAKQTFDSSATPEIGAVMMDAPKGRASIDMTDLESKMGHALEAAQENDPDALRRKIARLEQQLADGGGADATELEGARLELRAVRATLAVERARAARIADGLRAIAAETAGMAGELEDFKSDGSERAIAPSGTEGVQSTAAPAHPATVDGQRASREPNGGARAPLSSPAGGGNAVDPGGAGEQPGSSASNGDHPQLKAGMIRMLDVLCRYGPLVRRDLAILSRVSPVSGTVSDYLSTLRRRGLVNESGGRVEATVAGAAMTPTSARLPTFTPEEVYGMWADDLKAGARRMVEHLMRAYPEGFTRRELAGLSGISPQSGTVSDYMSTLRRRGLVVERARRVYAGDVLYLGGQR